MCMFIVYVNNTSACNRQLPQTMSSYSDTTNTTVCAKPVFREPKTHHEPEEAPTPMGYFCVADHETTVDDELALVKGEEITNVCDASPEGQQHTGWMYGTANGKTGFFPTAYAELR